MPEGRVGVRDGNRALGNLYRLQSRTPCRVAHVDDHTDPIHFPGHPTPHPRDARGLLPVATGRKQTLVVVGKLHEPGARLVTDRD